MRRRAAVAIVLCGLVPLAPEAAAPASGRPAHAASSPGAGRSPDVAGLQIALWGAGLYRSTVDGVRGPATTQAVQELQRRHGLPVDGVAGPATRRALGHRGRPRWGSRPLSAGMRGFDVGVLQWLLARQGFASGAMDGRFGARLDDALRRFQTWAGLGADGVAGPRTAAALARRPASSPLRVARPVAAAVGSPFGPRANWMHTGVDFPVAAGTAVAAAAAGCVGVASASAGGYGRLVVLSHTQGVTTYYAHLARIDVRAGQCVSAGARVGAAGSSGHSTGPHLHFEVRWRGAAVDPLSALR